MTSGGFVIKINDYIEQIKSMINNNYYYNGIIPVSVIIMQNDNNTNSKNMTVISIEELDRNLYILEANISKRGFILLPTLVVLVVRVAADGKI